MVSHLLVLLGCIAGVKSDCSCTGYVSENGYGKCNKNFEARPICYVNEPSSCTDKRDSTSGAPTKFSSEACGQEPIVIGRGAPCTRDGYGVWNNSRNVNVGSGKCGDGYECSASVEFDQVLGECKPKNLPLRNSGEECGDHFTFEPQWLGNCTAGFKCTKDDQIPDGAPRCKPLILGPGAQCTPDGQGVPTAPTNPGWGNVGSGKCDDGLECIVTEGFAQVLGKCEKILGPGEQCTPDGLGVPTLPTNSGWGNVGSGKCGDGLECIVTQGSAHDLGKCGDPTTANPGSGVDGSRVIFPST